MDLSTREPDDPARSRSVKARRSPAKKDNVREMALQMAREMLKASEQRQNFLLQLGDALRPLGNPVEVQEKASRLLGEYLGANRVGYAEAQESGESILLRRTYLKGVRSIDGLHRYKDYGEDLLRDLTAGRTVFHGDIPNDPVLPPSAKEAYADLELGATLNKPLLKDGKLVAVLFVHFREAHAFSTEEISLLEEVGERTWAAVERARAEEALRLSEAKYRTLFESIDEGFCLVEVLFDEHGKGEDYTFLETNPAFERQTGLKGVVGRRMRELIPDKDDYWFGIYGDIAMTGEPRRFEHAVTAMDRFYDVYAFRVGEPVQRRVAIVFNDITRRKRRETHAAFLAEVQDEFNRLGGVGEIMQSVGGMIGRYLDVDVFYQIEASDSDGVVSFRMAWDMRGTLLVGSRIRISDFVSVGLLDTYRQGGHVVVGNTFTDPWTNGEAFRLAGIGAFIAIPFRRQGKLESLLSICHPLPREWRDDEVELFREFANRLFPRLERARSDETVAADLHDTQLLRELGSRLVTEPDGNTIYQEMIAAAMKLMGADAGTVQLFDASTRELMLVAVEGFTPQVFERFGRLDASSDTSCGRAFEAGERIFVDFGDPSLRDTNGHLRWHLDAGYSSAQSTPLIGRSGRWIGLISTHWKERFRPAERQLRYLDLLARQVADAIEQRQTEKKVSDNEERLRTLFDSMSEAFIILEAVDDESGHTVDYRYVECNPAFSRQMGVVGDPRGRTVREVLPGIEPVWLENCDVVLRTGQPLQFEGFLSSVDRWLTVSSTRLGGEGSRRLSVVFMDISRRKQAEDALRKSEARLSSIFSEAEAGLSEISIDGHFLRVNDTLCRMLGRPREELMGMKLREVSLPDDMPFCIQEFERLVKEGVPVSIDKRYVLPGGRIIWANSTLSLLDLGTGEPPVILAVTVDLTERKKVEEALRDSRRHLELVLQSVKDYAIITTDEAGGITGWNPGAEKIFGYADAEVMGHGFSMIFTPEDQTVGIDRLELETARETGLASDERWHLRKDGKRIWLSGTVSPLLAGDQVAGFVKIARDLTEKREAENALLRSEERLRIALESAEMGAWDWDVLADKVEWNERHFVLLGLPPDGCSRASGAFLRFVHPEDRESVVAKLVTAVENTTDYQAEFRIIRADTGEVRWMTGYGRTVDTHEGRATRLTGVMYDSTERKISAEQLQRAHDELESRVNERTRELSEALERLRSEIAERAKLEGDRRELLKRLVTWQEHERARISRDLHDNLGQHMVAVKLGLDAMQAGLKQPKEVEAFDHLRQNVDSLIKATHRQAWELRPAELDHLGLEVALRHYIGDWSGRTGIPAEFHTEGTDDTRLHPDVEIAFYRVVQEALTNVARHSGASRVTVRLRMVEGGELLIEDDGNGFAPESVVKRLGLLGMGERISLIGGVLEIDSAAGKGTRVYAGLSEKAGWEPG